MLTMKNKTRIKKTIANKKLKKIAVSICAPTLHSDLTFLRGSSQMEPVHVHHMVFHIFGDERESQITCNIPVTNRINGHSWAHCHALCFWVHWSGCFCSHHVPVPPRRSRRLSGISRSDGSEFRTWLFVTSASFGAWSNHLIVEVPLCPKRQNLQMQHHLLGWAQCTQPACVLLGASL